MANFSHLFATGENIKDAFLNTEDLKKIDLVEAKNHLFLTNNFFSVKEDRVDIFLRNIYDLRKIGEFVSSMCKGEVLFTSQVIEGFDTTKVEFVFENGKAVKERTTTFEHGEEPWVVDFNKKTVGEWKYFSNDYEEEQGR